MPKNHSPRYDATFKRRAVEQVLFHHRIKILYWDNDGYAIWCKRLQAGRFRIPVAITGEGSQVALVSAAQLAMILEGIEPVAVKKRKRFTLQNTGSN